MLSYELRKLGVDRMYHVAAKLTLKSKSSGGCETYERRLNQ